MVAPPIDRRRIDTMQRTFATAVRLPTPTLIYQFRPRLSIWLLTVILPAPYPREELDTPLREVQL